MLLPGLAFNSIVNDSRLLKAHVQTSKICLLLLLNLLQIYYRFASATICDRAECRPWVVVAVGGVGHRGELGGDALARQSVKAHVHLEHSIAKA